MTIPKTCTSSVSKVVAFLYSNTLLGVVCIVVLWPSVFVAPYLIGAPGYAVLLLFASIFVLYIVCEGSEVWPRRRGVTAVLLASVVLVPYGVINTWLLGEFLESGAREERERERERGGQQLFERVRTEGSVPATDLADGWDRVCLVLPYDDFTDGTLQLDDSWSLEFFRGAEIVTIRTYYRRNVEFVDPPDQRCLPVVQAPAFFVATSDWSAQALMIKPVHP